ncbi:dihydrofolate reductase [Cognatishimia maritima]|uniref:Dihydrofolate reductase n=1 Tax=Cognatishimia maritima TaxID=870908 RepID=A0A1M5U3R8_9RHOB|nr:dihydrofolate reductase [Cognatishimia maritima]SHH57333.1 dihydrofolate reductase [Cognatishimia maritima]
MITLIVGRDRNGAIGKDNDIPWYAPEDLAFFKTETLGGAVVMGRNTWESLPFKPLKNRFNVVVSSQDGMGDVTVRSVEEAIAASYAAGYQRIYSMGGAGIYAAMLPLADRLLITEVDLEVEDADTYFPTFSDQDWILTQERPLRAADPKCTVTEYFRKR